MSAVLTTGASASPRKAPDRWQFWGRMLVVPYLLIFLVFVLYPVGYGLWLAPAVQDDPVYAEYWAGHRPLEVVIEEDQIIIRRAGADESDENSDDDNGDGDD